MRRTRDRGPAPKISQPVSSEDLTYGVSQLWLMDQDSAAKHHRQRRRRPADCHLHRSDEVGEVGGGVIDDPPGGCVANGGQLEYHPGVPGPVAAFWIGVEVIDELARSLHIARGGELLAELVRWLALVGESKGVPDGLPGDAVAAALVAEEVAPAAGARHAAARIASPGDRSGAGDQGDPGGELRRSQDELCVMDDLDRGAGDAGCDQLPQPLLGLWVSTPAAPAHTA